MKLYLVRHSNTKFERETASEEWVLSDAGVERAELLARHPLLADLDIVYTSMQLKAYATGLKIAEFLRKPMRSDQGLTELTSITKGFIPNYEEEVARLYNGDIDRIHDGETIDECMERVNGTIEKIVAQHADVGRLVVVSHCNALSIFAAQYDARTPYELHHEMAPRMPDVAILDWDTKQFDMPFGTFELEA